MNSAPRTRRGVVVAAVLALVAVAAVVAALALPGGLASAPVASVPSVPEPPRRGHHDAHDHPAAAPVPATTTPSPPAHTPAERLVAGTAASIGRWADVRAAEADGYASIGDALTGYEHFVHWTWAADDTILDPQRPESLMYEVAADGTRTLVSAMYVLPPGATMADVPDLGDERAVWHDHDNLCWSADRRLAGILRDGECFPGGEHVVSPPMLHVWIVPHPCGPFAGITGHGGGCAHGHGGRDGGARGAGR